VVIAMPVKKIVRMQMAVLGGPVKMQVFVNEVRVEKQLLVIQDVV
jgi:hypothetical protein